MSLKAGNVSNVTFGYNIYADGGASSPKNGSLKIDIETKDGKRFENAVQDCFVCDKEIKSSKNYVENMAEKILQYIKSLQNRLPKGDDKLEGIAICIPGQPDKQNVTPIIANLKTTSGESLRDIDFKAIPRILNEKGIKLADGFKLQVVNDMYGAVAGVTKILKTDFPEMLKEGAQHLLIMPGGGLGVGYIDVDNFGGENVARLRASESGHNVSKYSLKNLEKYGASVPAMIANFASVLGFNEKETEALIKTGNGKIPVQYNITEKYPSKAATRLQESKMFSMSIKDGETAIFTLKKGGQIISEKEFILARVSSINRFVNAIAEIAADKINEKTNSVILTGDFIGGLRKDVAKIPEYKGTSLEKMITEKALSLCDDVGRTLAKVNDFKVLFVKMKDNTSGGDLLLKGAFVGSNKWMNVLLKR